VKVLVTGATGFVASHLVPALAAVGHEVIAAGYDLDRSATGAGVEQFELDLTGIDATKLPAVDAIVHLAQANVPFPEGAGALFAVNTASTVALLEHARACGSSTFVYASSASVYGLGERPWTEEDPTGATDFYSSTKLASERFVGAYAGDLSTWCLRFVAPYGSGQRNRLIPRLIANVQQQAPVTLNAGGRPRMNPIHVRDVVSVVLAALATPGSGVVNVAGDETASIKQLAEEIGRLVGRVPIFAEGGGGAAGDLVCDNSLMHETFGLETLVPLVAGLEDAIRGREGGAA